eukprot:jgi/Mesen1/7327/ME000376S06488
MHVTARVVKLLSTSVSKSVQPRNRWYLSLPSLGTHCAPHYVGSDSEPLRSSFLLRTLCGKEYSNFWQGRPYCTKLEPMTSGTKTGGNGGAAEMPAPEGFSVLKEGEARILQHGNDVFYNKAQIVNRDLSIAALRLFVEKRQAELLANKGKRQHKKGPANRKDHGPQAASNAGEVAGEPNSSNGPDATAEAEETQEGREPDTAPATGLGTETEPIGNAAGSTSGGDKQGAGEAAGADTKQGAGGGAVGQPGAAARPLQVLEALAASGLRAIRYAKEIDGLGKIVALDNDKLAVEACHRNVEFNGPAAAAVSPEEADARVYMLTHEKQFDAVDLDPYGSPSVFLDSAVQSVADGGLLMCTATDMAVLCGNNAEVCYSKYGAYALRGKYCHEMALRILLASIESHANKYKRHIVPLVSLSIDFYVRVFVRVYTSANAVKETPSKLAYVFQCASCDSFHLQPVGRIAQKNNHTRYMPATGPTVKQACDDCGKHYNLGGPIWAAPIHDPAWVHDMLARVRAASKTYPAYDKIHSILTGVSEELVDVPLYLSLHSLSATLKCTPPSAMLFRSAVVNAGYRISGSHANPLALKTDAPMHVVWDIMRCWVQSHPVKAHAPDSAGFALLAKEPALKANFTRASGAVSRAQATGVARFLPNPEQYWGPKPRAGRNVTAKHNGGASNHVPASKRTDPVASLPDENDRDAKRARTGLGAIDQAQDAASTEDAGKQDV